MATEPKPLRLTSADRAAASFLLRVWEEPRANAGEPAIVRVFLRNLKTNEEIYLNDLQALGELVRRSLHTGVSDRLP